MYPVGRICSRLAEESRLIDRRILVLSQMATAWRSIPSLPGPSSVSVATQTVAQTYVDASVQAVSVRCMPRAEFLAKIRELVQENALTRCHRAIFHTHFLPVFTTLSPTHSLTTFTFPLLSLFSTLFSCYRLAIRLTTFTNSYDLTTIPFALFLFFIHTLSFDEMRT